MLNIEAKNKNKELRKKRVRAKISGNEKRPRLSVCFSNKHIAVQLIDDMKGNTLLYKTDKHLKKEGKTVEIAKELGKVLAKEAKTKKINEVVFDKGHKKYHGKVKALADGAREEGLEF